VPKAIRLALKYSEFYDQRPTVQGWIDNGIEGPSGKALTPERKAELEEMLVKMPSATTSADECLTMAEARLNELEHLEHGGAGASWTDPTSAASKPYTHGCVARGYISVIDGTPQPYGLELPDGPIAEGEMLPLYVWLHGRGAQSTDVHFIRERMRSRGGMAPTRGIVLHPFGRQCVGYKSAGAIDVLHAIEAVKAQYPIDVDRIVLYGFSMGGAGSWSVGAHYPDIWAAIQPGAGFAETFLFYDDESRPEDGPSGEYGEPGLPAQEGPIHGRVHVRDLPDYEIKLWGEGDATAYTRNLFNVPVLAYSGENDRQLQASRVMEAAYEAEGEHLPHVIGPGMGHAFHPDTKAEILLRLEAEVRKGRDTDPDSISLQTRTLRYNRCHWLTIEGLDVHWEDSRLDAKRIDYTHSEILSANTQLVVIASGVSAFT
jgi:dienelactone hydrolase